MTLHDAEHDLKEKNAFSLDSPPAAGHTGERCDGIASSLAGGNTDERYGGTAFSFTLPLVGSTAPAPGKFVTGLPRDPCGLPGVGIPPGGRPRTLEGAREWLQMDTLERRQFRYRHRDPGGLPVRPTEDEV